MRQWIQNKGKIHTRYATLASGIPWNIISLVTCFFLVYTQAFLFYTIEDTGIKGINATHSAHDGKVGFNTVKNTMGLLYSYWLYFLFYGITCCTRDKTDPHNLLLIFSLILQTVLKQRRWFGYLARLGIILILNIESCHLLIVVQQKTLDFFVSQR